MTPKGSLNRVSEWPKPSKRRSKRNQNPSKMDPKSIKNGSWKMIAFWNNFFIEFPRCSISKSIDFGLHFGPSGHLLPKMRILKKLWFSLGKTMIFKVSTFKKTTKIKPKTHQNEDTKKAVQKPLQKSILGRILASQTSPKSKKNRIKNHARKSFEKNSKKTLKRNLS